MRKRNKYSLVRFFHAISDQGPIDIYLNDKIYFKSLVFTEFTPYFYLPIGKYDLKIFSHNSVQYPLVSKILEIKDIGFQNIAISGRDLNIDVLSIKEDQSSSILDTSKIRAISLIPIYPIFDISFNGEVLISSVEYKIINDYIDIEPGDYKLKIISTYHDELIIKSKITVRPNTSYTLYFLGTSPTVSILQAIDGNIN